MINYTDIVSLLSCAVEYSAVPVYSYSGGYSQYDLSVMECDATGFNFYLANQDNRYGGVPYDSVRAQVFLDYQQGKAGAAYQEYINKLAEVEQVRFYDGNW